ncbi:MAG: SRPBCC domain-containing protein, partial [Calditrichia bacterium]
MPQDTVSGTALLRISRIFAAPREKVYEAWTQVEQLKNWWRMGANWITPIAEVDLQVGGKYRLGMQPPDKDAPYIVGGVFQEIIPAKKLVYTWRWEGQEEETVVTVEFIERGEKTELI